VLTVAEELRRRLSVEERNVLVWAARGGPSLVRERVSGVRTERAAAELIAVVKAKAQRIAEDVRRSREGLHPLEDVAYGVAGVEASDFADTMRGGAGAVILPKPTPAPTEKFEPRRRSPAKRKREPRQPGEPTLHEQRRAAVLAFLRERAPVKQKAVHMETGINQPAVSVVLTELCDEGIVRRCYEGDKRSPVIRFVEG
jgi:hypothetical protein